MSDTIDLDWTAFDQARGKHPRQKAQQGQPLPIPLSPEAMAQIKIIQRKAGLPATGQLDASTVQYVNAKYKKITSGDGGGGGSKKKKKGESKKAAAERAAAHQRAIAAHKRAIAAHKRALEAKKLRAVKKIAAAQKRKRAAELAKQLRLAHYAASTRGNRTINMMVNGRRKPAPIVGAGQTTSPRAASKAAVKRSTVTRTRSGKGIVLQRGATAAEQSAARARSNRRTASLSVGSQRADDHDEGDMMDRGTERFTVPQDSHVIVRTGGGGGSYGGGAYYSGGGTADLAITPGGRVGDASSLARPGYSGKRKTTDYEREIAHALMKKGHSKSRAIAMARGLLNHAASTGRWGRRGKASAAVRAGAVASRAQRASFTNAQAVQAVVDLANELGETFDLGQNGSKWRHGFIPLNPAAVALKLKKPGAHGRSSGRSSKSRAVAKFERDGQVVSGVGGRQKGRTPQRAQAKAAVRALQAAHDANPDRGKYGQNNDLYTAQDKASARVQVRPGTYQGESGHHVTGTDTKGRSVKVFAAGDRAEAEKVRNNIKNGDSAFAHRSTEKRYTDAEAAKRMRARVGDKVTTKDGKHGEITRTGTVAGVSAAQVRHDDGTTKRYPTEHLTTRSDQRGEYHRKHGGPSDDEIRAAQKRTGIYPADKLTVKSHALVGKDATVEHSTKDYSRLSGADLRERAAKGDSMAQTEITRRAAKKTAKAMRDDGLVSRASEGDYNARRKAVYDAATQGRATLVPAGARDNKTAMVHIDGKPVGQASTIAHLVREGDPVGGSGGIGGAHSRNTFGERKLHPGDDGWDSATRTTRAEREARKKKGSR